ncbi:MAG: cytochrome c [Actinomycetota bacterium]|nr:cytochrome c [Actinomycetota bacterium]
MTYRSPDEAVERSTDKWMVWGVALMAVMIMAFAIYFWFESSSRADASEAHEAELVAHGSEAYAANCGACHGASGEGGIGPALNSTQFLGDTVDDQIKALIAVGIPGSDMAAYALEYGGALTAEEVDAVTAFIRSWEEDAPDNPEWRSSMTSTK